MALPYLLKAKELSPNKQIFRFALSNTYLNIGKRALSLQETREAYELAPEYDDAKVNYILSLILNGKESTALDLLGSATTSDSRITQAYLFLASDYLQKNDKWGAVQQVQKAIKINPSFEEQGKEIIDAIWAGNVELQGN
jgi:tetratricopeptide (TPR) repeat protein